MVVPSSSTLFLLSFVCLFLVFLCHGIEASHKVSVHLQNSESLVVKDEKQPYRTGYHFQPPKNWMNGILSLSAQSVWFDKFGLLNIFILNCLCFY